MDGLMRVRLDADVPVLSAVLTPQHFADDGDTSFFASHLAAKGVEAAEACSLSLASLATVPARAA